MISPAVASFLSASGHLSRISRIDIRTMILQHNMFHSTGQLDTIRRRRSSFNQPDEPLDAFVNPYLDATLIASCDTPGVVRDWLRSR